MKRSLLIFLIFCIIQSIQGQKSASGFCGLTYQNKNKIKQQLGSQFDFLKVEEGDIIVDIGAGSGWYEGAFSAISDWKNLTFFLVDINHDCLNDKKVNNMITNYSGIKGSPITNKFIQVNNSADSLFLPQRSYKKVWIMNTLHEIPDQQKIIKDIWNILKDEGELIILELIPRKTGELHGGCHKPLLSFDEIKKLTDENGFSFVEKQDIPHGKIGLQMIRLKKIVLR